MAFSFRKNLFALSLAAPLGLAALPVCAQVEKTAAQDAVAEFDLCKKPLMEAGWQNEGNGPEGKAPSAAFSENKEAIVSFRTVLAKNIGGDVYRLSAEFRHFDFPDTKLRTNYFHISVNYVTAPAPQASMAYQAFVNVVAFVFPYEKTAAARPEPKAEREMRYSLFSGLSPSSGEIDSVVELEPKFEPLAGAARELAACITPLKRALKQEP